MERTPHEGGRARVGWVEECCKVEPTDNFDGTFVHLPLHEVATLTEAVRRAVLKMFVSGGHLTQVIRENDTGVMATVYLV